MFIAVFVGPDRGLGKCAQGGQSRAMDSPTPPVIFSPARRLAMRARMRRLQRGPVPARYIGDDMAEDVLERLSFLRHEVRHALVVGDFTGIVADALRAQGADVTRADPVPGPGEVPIDEERPLPFPEPFDLIVSMGTLDTVNDLPGALVHIRRALAPGGLAIMAIMGAGSLPVLRHVMLEADGDCPSPRIHPQVDVRAGGQLLQRCGFADPVVDSRPLHARFSTLLRLVGDLREQGLTSCLIRGGSMPGKAGLHRAQAAFTAAADEQARVTETFEILTLSGWAKELRPPKF